MKSLLQNFFQVKPPLFWALAIALVNLIFKIVFFSDYALWYDEVYTLQTSLLNFVDIRYTCRHDVSAPFYYYLVHNWITVFGYDEVSLRSVSLVFNTLSIFSLYLFASRVFNERTAWFACILFFTSSSLFFYAQELRVYSFLVFLSIVSMWSFCEFLFKGYWKAALCLALFNFLGIKSHYLFVLLPFVQFAIIVLYSDRKKLLMFGAAGLLSLVSLGEWFGRMLDVMKSGGTSSFVSLPSSQLIPELLSGYIMIGVMGLAIITGLVFHFVKHRDYSEKTVFSFLILLVWSIVILKITHIAGKGSSVYIVRYLLFTVPGFMLLAGYMYSKIPFNNKINIGVLSLLFVVGVAKMDLSIEKNMDYKTLVSDMKVKFDDPSSLVLVQNRGMANTFMYYYDREKFESPKTISEKPYQKDLLFVNTSEDIAPVDFSAYKDVYLTQTYEKFSDPEKTLVTTLQSIYEQEIIDTTYRGVIVRHYTGNEYDPGATKISAMGDDLALFGMIANIKSNKEWYDKLVLKAQDLNLPIDTVLKQDALYMINLEKKN